VTATIQQWLDENAAGLRPVIIADATVSDLHPGMLPGVPRITFPAGEHSKSRETWGALSDRLLASGHDRHTLVIALGGGVATDLAGFVAATLLRGVPWLAVPSTTLSMLDASIGGKTGVDTPLGKNLIGAFHPPRAVFADPELLGTLPDAPFLEGLAEAVKHAAVASAAHWEWLARHADSILAREPQALATLIADSVAIKAEIVAGDEREEGRRAILNAGHTWGHAVEHASDYQLPHGHAVAIGLVREARLGESRGVTEPGTADRLAALLGRLHLPTELPIPLSRERIAGALGHDKKNVHGEVRTVLLRKVGEVARTRDGRWTHPVSADAFQA
jgi:3-dehydroquinate synthase